jgi:prophage DNA circulation protein
MALGCYQDLYAPASFKGVPFEAMEAGSEHGRRGAEGEFPFGERTAYADMGRRIRTYTIKGRFVLNSHIADSSVLIAACESVGPGPFSHPTRGLVMAACKSIKVTDDVMEGQGITIVDIEFVEANEWPSGMSLIGTVLGIFTDDIILSATDDFAQAYLIDDVAVHRQPQVIAAASRSVMAILAEFKKAVASAPDATTNQIISDFNTLANDSELLRDKAMLTKAISLGIQAVANKTTGDDKFQAMRNIANANARSSSIPDSSASVENSIYEFSRVVAAATMGQAIMEIRFGSMNEAFNYLDKFMSLIQSEISLAYAECRNSTFINLRRFTVDAQNSILVKAFTLPGLVRYNFGGGVHPLAAAYSIYGDAKRHRDLEMGNLLTQSGRFGSTVTSVSL